MHAGALDDVGVNASSRPGGRRFLMDEPLPSAEDLGRIVASTFASAGLQETDAGTRGKAIDALIGLAAFPAEQALAMSVTKNGLDVTGLWERKRQVIEQTPGLSVWRGGETFEGIGGVENVKTFLRAVIAGAEPPRVVVFIDEIEKHLAGTGTDLSGVKTEMTGALLTWMQDRRADGCIFIGPPGAAKSAVAKATGNTAGIPTIAFDLAGMQSSLVGASGDCLRTALKIVDAVSQAGPCSLPRATRLPHCRPNCDGGLLWARSSLTCLQPRNAARSGKSIPVSTPLLVSRPTTRAGPAQKSKSAAGKLIG